MEASPACQRAAGAQSDHRWYSVHQIVQAFLVQRGPRQEALQRHATYYAEVLERCDRELEHETTIDAALARLDSEIGQIERGQQQAVAASAHDTPGWHALTIRYAMACHRYFSLRGRYQQWLDWAESGVQAAEHQDDEWKTGALVGSMGNVYRLLGRYEEAITHYQQSLEIKQHIGDVAGAAQTYWNLGRLYAQQGDLAVALPLLERCVQWKEQIGHPDARADRTYVEELRARLQDGAPAHGRWTMMRSRWVSRLTTWLGRASHLQ